MKSEIGDSLCQILNCLFFLIEHRRDTDSPFVKNLLNRQSIAQKLTFLTLVITVVGTVAILSCVYYFTLDLNMRFLSNELRERQAIIERAYVEPLWNFDQVQIGEVSKSLLTNNDYTFLTAVRVMDPRGNVLFQTNNSKDQKFSFEEYAKRPFSKLGVSQVKKDGEVLGTVYVIFTSEGIMSQYRGLLSSIFLISLLIVSFTSVWIYFFMNRLLTHPLNKLLDHVKDLRNEQYEAKEYTGLSHELQLIANALNFTATLVKKRNDDLKNHSDNLERMVADRTSELENQILKNVHASRQ
jgi:methyl-accepting chemotaxis protein